MGGVTIAWGGRQSVSSLTMVCPRLANWLEDEFRNERCFIGQTQEITSVAPALRHFARSVAHAKHTSVAPALHFARGANVARTSLCRFRGKLQATCIEVRAWCQRPCALAFYIGTAFLRMACRVCHVAFAAARARSNARA